MTPHFIIPTTKLSESVQESHSQHTNTSLYPAMPQSYTFYSTAGMGMHHNAATTAGMMPLSAPGFPMLTNSLPHMMPYMSSAATSQSATPVPPEASSESDKKNTAASRKGKWTLEEEKYTNKVIEYFNAGLLKIDSNDRNITLRAYLAEKLGCDPMRITKKYTGSSCLGKRVYHFDHVNVSTEGVERASQELKKLEEAFQQKLIQMNQRRFNDLHSTLEACHTVSTPTIDALMKRNRAHRPIVPLVPTSSTLPQAYISNISNLTYPAPLYAPYSNMQPVFMYPSAANAQQFLMPNVPTTFPSAHGYWYGNQLVYPPQNIAPMPTVSAENNMPPPPSAPKEEACVSEIATESLESQDNQHAEGQQDIAADFWSPLKTIAHMEDIKQSVPAESSPPMKVAKVQSDDETSVENSIGTNSTSYSRSMQKRKVEVIDEEDLISSNKRIKPSSDSQQTNSQHQSAAHSFLDFICHVKKISSQEDLAEFFEGVQKSVATSSNATKSPAASTASNNKSSSTLVSRGSVDSFQKMITPSIGII